jgi:hypothetical protein
MYTLVLPLGLLAAAGTAALFGRPVLAVGLAACTLALLLLLGLEKFLRRARRSDSAGYRYVMIEPDGTARELRPDEVSHVEAVYGPGDGAAPYIKPWYTHRNARGDLGGYLLRDRLPPSATIEPSDSSPTS